MHDCIITTSKIVLQNQFWWCQTTVYANQRVVWKEISYQLTPTAATTRQDKTGEFQHHTWVVLFMQADCFEFHNQQNS